MRVPNFSVQTLHDRYQVTWTEVTDHTQIKVANARSVPDLMSLLEKLAKHSPPIPPKRTRPSI